MMNAELSATKPCGLIVPTLFREESLDCLRVLTREGEPAPFVSVMHLPRESLPELHALGTKLRNQNVRLANCYVRQIMHKIINDLFKEHSTLEARDESRRCP